MAAVAVCHALLSKKDARAALAWLVIVCLVPLFGSIAYAAFGVNRISRKATRLRKINAPLAAHRMSIDQARLVPENAGNLSDIARAGDELSDNPVLPGNHLKILENGDEAYPSMITAINRAGKSIALSSYIFRLDEVGERFVEALGEAATRGVEVKVLVDGFGGGIFSSPVARKLNKLGIDARRFQFSFAPWNIPYLNLRNHKKLLVVDGRTGFVGGMNLGNENLLRKKTREQVQDMHFQLTGPVVGQLLESFAADWHFVTGDELDTVTWQPKPDIKGETTARVINSGPDHQLGKIETLLAMAIASAKRNISIVTPYFLADNKITFLLQLAAIRGVDVDIIVPQKTDSRIFDWAFENNSRFLGHPRINLLRSPRPFDHAKLFMVDDEWCAIGSPNWDVRSMRLNFEILVECHDRETVSRLARVIRRKKNASVSHSPIKKTLNTLPIRLRNAACWLLQPYM